MDEQRLTNIISAKLENTLGWVGGDLQKQRQKALQYYRGEPFGNEQDGRSSVVSRDVAEAIDQAMPSLSKVFMSTDTYVVFSPRKPQDEEAAKQKTDYVNYVLQSQPNWFNLNQTCLKDGLLSKLGVFKSWWDESTTVVPEEYEGLTKVQYMMLLADENVEEVECHTRPAGAPEGYESGGNGSEVEGQPNQGQPPAPMAPQMGANPLDDGLLYDCKIKRTNKSGKVCIDVIPPEEFLIERRTVSLEAAGFVAHRSSRTRSELIEMGFDREKVMGLPAYSDNLEINPEKVTRFYPEDTLAYQATTQLDPTMEKIFVAECYLKVDYNGDGVAEWRKVTVAGAEANTILDNEECDGHPFHAWTPYIQPHKLIGESMADKTQDIQLWKSTIVREMNDGAYFNNTPQLVVIEGQANMEDVLTRRPGGVIRASRPDAVTALSTQDMAQSCMSIISYIDSVKETRTGIRRFSAGLEGDELNPYASTATGAKLVDDSSQDTMMLIARNYAEQALKPLCERIAELIQKYQDKPSTVKLRGKWVDVDPSSWNSEMDSTVTVGLGTGNKDATVSHLMAMMTQVDAPIASLQGGLSGPLLTANNVYNKLTKLTEAMGFKAADQFYTDPQTAPPQPPKPDPKMAEVQGKLQLQQQQGQIKLQLDQQKAQQDAQIEREKAARQANTEAAQAQADIATDRMHAQNQAQLEQIKLQAEQQREQMRMEHELALERVRMAHELEMHRIKTAADVQATQLKAKAAAKAKPKTKVMA